MYYMLLGSAHEGFKRLSVCVTVTREIVKGQDLQKI